MKKEYGAVYQIAWPSHKGCHPAGKARVFAEQRYKIWRGEDVPEWMRIWERRLPEYTLSWAPILPPRKLWPRERKAKLRKANLRKRIEAKFPLFAEIMIQEELANDPEYFEARTNERKPLTNP